MDKKRPTRIAFMLTALLLMAALSTLTIADAQLTPIDVLVEARPVVVPGARFDTTWAIHDVRVVLLDNALEEKQELYLERGGSSLPFPQLEFLAHETDFIKFKFRNANLCLMQTPEIWLKAEGHERKLLDHFLVDSRADPPILPDNNRCLTDTVRTGPDWVDGAIIIPIIEGTAPDNNPLQPFILTDFLVLVKKWLKDLIPTTDLFDYLNSH